MSACKHPSVLAISAQHLLAEGSIETYDAVYRWHCPLCGMPRRTTRLADTMYALRHAYGWVIDTVRDNGQDMLARYVLVEAGDMPGDPSTGTHPRVLTRARAAVQATMRAALSADTTPSWTAAAANPKYWRCTNCQRVTSKPEGDLMLGGWRKVQCECASGKYTVYIPTLSAD